MIQATMFEAKTKLSELVRKAQAGEQVILTNGRDRTPVAALVAIQPPMQRAFDLFYSPGFEIPADFDTLPAAELEAWSGEGSGEGSGEETGERTGEGN